MTPRDYEFLMMICDYGWFHAYIFGELLADYTKGGD